MRSSLAPPQLLDRSRIAHVRQVRGVVPERRLSIVMRSGPMPFRNSLISESLDGMYKKGFSLVWLEF